MYARMLAEPKNPLNFPKIFRLLRRCTNHQHQMMMKITKNRSIENHMNDIFTVRLFIIPAWRKCYRVRHNVGEVSQES